MPPKRDRERQRPHTHTHTHTHTQMGFSLLPCSLLPLFSIFWCYTIIRGKRVWKYAALGRWEKWETQQLADKWLSPPTHSALKRPFSFFPPYLTLIKQLYVSTLQNSTNFCTSKESLSSQKGETQITIWHYFPPHVQEPKIIWGLLPQNGTWLFIVWWTLI